MSKESRTKGKGNNIYSNIFWEEQTEKLTEKLKEAYKFHLSQVECFNSLFKKTCTLLEESTSVECFIYCSYCNEDLLDYCAADTKILDKFNYCPYCGARIIRSKK